MCSTTTLPAINSTYGCLYIAAACVRLTSHLNAFVRINRLLLDRLSMALWGSGTVQLYSYYDRYRKTDKRWTMALLLVTYVLDTTHQALVLKSLYIYFVKNFANSAYLEHFDRSLIDTSVLAGIISACVQSLFIRRIWSLSRSNVFLTAFISCLVMAQLAATLVYFGLMYNFTEIAQLSLTRKAEHTVIIITAVVDFSIAATMAFLLHSIRIGFKATNTIVDRLIIYTIGTGFLTGVLCLVAVATSLAFPDTFIWMLVMITLPKLYFNSMLASLNCRQGLRDNLADMANTGPTLPTYSRTLSPHNATGNNGLLGALNFSSTTRVSFVSEPETAHTGYGSQKQGRALSIRLCPRDSLDDLDLKCQGTDAFTANANVLDDLPQVHAKT
ncbi:hypothetical protein M0805_002086 [Coniferiporia weirii]|nr:hypothetical protein M0805_002086 [Coniferiporia weirii]